MHSAPEGNSRVLAENRRHYELLVEIARRYAGQHDVERLLRAAMVAANYAWLAPVGLLSDVRLESAVIHAVRGSREVRVDGGRRAGRVLHVLSEAYSVGGHTRLAWRWMSQDERTSDVVLTNQLGPVPLQLVESARATGGEVHDLRSSTQGLLERARALREHMERADVVVLHVHPYDSVVLAAVNLPGVRPPVVYENHADLQFWLGVGGADLVCDLRPQVRMLDVGLRGLPEERIGVLPMPMEAMIASSGPELRRQLGIRPDAVVALTVSADWKMAATWGRGMHHLVERVLHWSPQVSVVLVGATPNEDWARVSRRYPGRVFPVGRVPDPAPYFALADVYIESYPVRAGTSPLEAAMLGLPVVALVDLPESDPAHVFQMGYPGLVGHPVTETADKFAVAVRHLALDPELREREGAAGRARVLESNDGPGWRAGLESLYERARSLPACDIDAMPDSPTDERYGVMLLAAISPGLESPDPRRFVTPLGELFDRTMESDLLAGLLRGESASFQVRVAPDWQLRPGPMSRLLALAATHPRLTVSLPFVPDDDVQGAVSVARLTELLAAVGRTTDDCGDIRLETAPGRAALSLNGELPLIDDALDRLEGLLSSPLWDEPSVANAHAGEPQPVGV